MTENTSKQNDIKTILSKDGPFSTQLYQYKPREIQLEMAQAVLQTISTQGRLVVEAGTGTGKTLAYLIPALLSRKKTLISTGTKTLQDQLFNKDLPLILKSLKIQPQIALLKGRANYLCHHRLQQTLEQGLLTSKALVSDLQRLKTWSLKTLSGDLADSSGLNEDSALIPMVTSTIDNCLGSQCGYYDECFVVKARQRAMEADVVVINHYLFFADLSIKEDGFGEILPEADVLIFDESHQLAEIARNFLGSRFSSRQVLELARDVKAEYVNQLKDCSELQTYSEIIEKDIADWRLLFGSDRLIRENWRKWHHRVEIKEITQNFLEHLQQLIEIIEPQLGRTVDLDNCYERACQLKKVIHDMVSPAQEDAVKWIETFSKTFAISQTPLNLHKDLENLMLRHQSASWIFTSATLSVDNQLNHFMELFSLNKSELTTRALVLKSPFDYAKNTLLYLPRFLPEPNIQNATELVMDMAIPLIKMSEGATFVLLTSYRALNIAKEKLRHLPYPQFVQGDLPKSELLAEFKQHKNSILIATSSFWEGVDVAGEQLKLVIIDRLPFASPMDPIVQARTEYYRKQGIDPFSHFQIPEAVISLKQGAGRLIRTEQDKGVLAILDPRLISRRYGEAFIDSLPPFARTREQNKVKEFYQQISD